MDSDHKTLEQEAIESLDTLAAVPGFTGIAGRLIGWIDTLFTTLAVLALVAIAGTVMLQIVTRLLLPISPVWTEELSRYLFIYMVALAVGTVLHKNRNISVELFHHRLGVRGRAFYQALICLTIAVFAWIVLPHAWLFAKNGAWQMSPALRIPMLYIFFSTVVMFALLLAYGIIGFLEGSIAMFRSQHHHSQETP